MKGPHIVRCVELYHFPLVCHVTEHTTILKDTTPLSLTCTDISYNMPPLTAVVEECSLSLKMKAEMCLRNVCVILHSITHYNTVIFKPRCTINLILE